MLSRLIVHNRTVDITLAHLTIYRGWLRDCDCQSMFPFQSACRLFPTQRLSVFYAYNFSLQHTSQQNIVILVSTTTDVHRNMS